MKLFSGFFKRPANDAQAEREKEINYRMNRRSLERQALKLQHDAERAREEARRFELGGNHAKAVAKAAEARNLLKTHDSIMQNLNSIDGSYALSKQCETIRKANETVISLSREVMSDGIVEQLTGIEAERDTTILHLEENAERMEAFVEGLNTGNGIFEDNPAGEEALAEIMREERNNVEPAEIPLPEPDSVERPEWAREQRRALEELAAE